MSKHHFLCASVLAAASVFSMSAQAGEPTVYLLPSSGGVGIPYHLGFYFDGSGSASAKSDDVLPVLGDTITSTVGKTASKSWFGDLNYDANGDGEKTLLGWTHNSKWGLVDLTALRAAGYTRATVRISVSRLDDGNHDVADADDDLVPATTVWRGVDQTSAQSHWYPNAFQPNESYEDPVGSGNYRNWWSTLDGHGLEAVSATPISPLKKVTVVQPFKLDKKDNTMNALTFVIGGNDYAAAKHSANFQVQVDVTAK